MLAGKAKKALEKASQLAPPPPKKKAVPKGGDNPELRRKVLKESVKQGISAEVITDQVYIVCCL